MPYRSEIQIEFVALGMSSQLAKVPGDQSSEHREVAHVVKALRMQPWSVPGRLELTRQVVWTSLLGFGRVWLLALQACNFKFVTTNVFFSIWEFKKRHLHCLAFV